MKRHLTHISAKKVKDTAETTETPSSKKLHIDSESLPRKKTVVVHMKREHGVVVQDCDVYIGRACNRGGWHLPQSKFYNPFSIGRDGSRAAVMRKFEAYIATRADLLSALGELRGKVLRCWCKPEACHGDILARLADAESPAAAGADADDGGAAKSKADGS